MAVSPAVVLRPRAQASAAAERITSTSASRSSLATDRVSSSSLSTQRTALTSFPRLSSSISRSSSRRNLNVCNSLSSQVDLLLAREQRYAQAAPVTISDDDPVAQLQHKIKLAASWQDVRDLITAISASQRPAHLAVAALQRLGCMYVHASEYTRSQLRSSGCLESLNALVTSGLPSLRGMDLLTCYDALARLQYSHGKPLLEQLAAFLPQYLPSLDSQQLPQLLWAFGTLGFKPQPLVLKAVARELQAKAGNFSGRSTTWVVWACGRLGWQPSNVVLTALAEAVSRNLDNLQAAELRACLVGFAGFNFVPSNKVMQAIAAHSGKTWDPPKPHAQAASEMAVAAGLKAGMRANSAVTASLKRIKKQYQAAKAQADESNRLGKCRDPFATAL